MVEWHEHTFHVSRTGFQIDVLAASNSESTAIDTSIVGPTAKCRCQDSSDLSHPRGLPDLR